VLMVFTSSRVPPDVLLPALADRMGQQTVKHIVERHLLLEPERSIYLNALHALADDSKEIADFLRPNLSRRPISMQWHRAYQSSMMDMGKNEELEREYQQMLAGDPQNADLIYLAGRATRDLDHRLALLQQAASANPPCAYAFYTMCVDYLSNAQFPEAAENAKRAAALIKDDPQLLKYCIDALNAAGDYEDSLNIIQSQELAQMPRSLEAYVEEMYVHLLQNQPSKAEDAISHIRNLAHEATPQYEAEDVASAQAIRAYVLGNAEEYVSTLKSCTDPDLLLTAAITAGDFNGIKGQMDKARVDAYIESLIYLCALQHGDKKTADESFKQMIDMMSGRADENQAYAAAVQGKSKIPVSQLFRMYLPPKQKAAMLIILGLNDPGLRDQCFAMAEKLNFDKRFPHLFFKSLLEHPPVH
jgi:hypothetical protein